MKTTQTLTSQYPSHLSNYGALNKISNHGNPTKHIFSPEWVLPVTLQGLNNLSPSHEAACMEPERRPPGQKSPQSTFIH